MTLSLLLAFLPHAGAFSGLPVVTIDDSCVDHEVTAAGSAVSTATGADATHETTASCIGLSGLATHTRFTAPSAGTYRFDVAGADADDATVYLLADDCSGAELACNYDFGWHDSVGRVTVAHVEHTLSAGESVVVGIEVTEKLSASYPLNITRVDGDPGFCARTSSDVVGEAFVDSIYDTTAPLGQGTGFNYSDEFFLLTSNHAWTAPYAGTFSLSLHIEQAAASMALDYQNRTAYVKSGGCLGETIAVLPFHDYTQTVTVTVAAGEQLIVGMGSTDAMPTNYSIAILPTTVRLDPTGEDIGLDLTGSEIVWTDDGYRSIGIAGIETPLGLVWMPDADLSFTLDEHGQVDTVAGTVGLELPGFGMFAGAVPSGLMRANVGYNTGAALADLDAPLADDRKYLFFEYDPGFEFESGPMALSSNTPSATMVLDPLDPMFYLHGDITGLGIASPIEEAGIGVSMQGLIPFVPEQTWGISAAYLNDFNGHLVIDGVVPVRNLPLEVEGEVIFELPTVLQESLLADGGPTLEVPDVSFEDLHELIMPDMGANGTLLFSADAGLLNVTLELAHASMRRVDGVAYFSGRTADRPDMSWFSGIAAVGFQGDFYAAGVLDGDDSYLVLEGEIDVGGFVVTGTIRVDRDGVTLEVEGVGVSLDARDIAAVVADLNVGLGASGTSLGALAGVIEDLPIDIPAPPVDPCIVAPLSCVISLF
jgi:hypothetical protein